MNIFNGGDPMARTFKAAFIILLFILLLSPTLLFADEDDLYDRPGFDPNRETLPKVPGYTVNS